MIIHDLAVVNGREKGVQSNIKRLTSMNSNGLSIKMSSVFFSFVDVSDVFQSVAFPSLNRPEAGLTIPSNQTT